MECGIHHHSGEFLHIQSRGFPFLFAPFAASREPFFGSIRQASIRFTRRREVAKSQWLLQAVGFWSGWSGGCRHREVRFPGNLPEPTAADQSKDFLLSVSRHGCAAIQD
jgi:hypothetical protein